MSAKASFTHPEDFAPVKGRANRFTCKLCTPPGRTRGQAMTLETALRHETENDKHRANAEAAHPAPAPAPVALDAWDWEYQPNIDWGPKPVPEGSSAWEMSYPSDRVEDLIAWWREGVFVAHRGEEPERMDSFIDRFNKRYQDEVDGWSKTLETLATGEGAEVGAEVVEEGWDGVPGNWYTGGSFLPEEDDGPPRQWGDAPSKQRDVEADKRVWGADDEDPYAVWGIPRDEVTPWSNAPPVSGAGVHQTSDTTPNAHIPPSDFGVSPKPARRPYRKGHRRGGRGHGQKYTVVEGATGRPDVVDNLWA